MKTGKLLEIAENRRRADGWTNPLTGLGTRRDKTRATFFRLGRLLQPEEIDAYMVGNDLLQTIVSAIIEDAMREGFHLREAKSDESYEQSPDKEAAAAVEQQIKALDGPSLLKEAAIWGRAYGRAAVVMIAAETPTSPLESGEVIDLWVADKRELTPWRWYSDPTAPKYGTPETYLLSPTVMGSTAPQYFEIHETRLILFGGALTPKRVKIVNDNSDVSVLQSVIDIVRAAEGNWAAACAMLADGSQGVLKIKGLIAAVAAGKSDVIAERLQFMDSMRSVVRSLPLDAEGEEFDYKQRSWSGIPEFLTQTWTRIAAAGKIPMTRLFRSFPGGLNSGSGDGDARWWYDDVRAYQRDVLGPAIVQLATVLSPGKEWEVCWPDLEKPDPKDEAQVKLSTAQTDQIYISNDVLLPGQIARCRFGKGVWSPGYDGIDLEAQEAALERAEEHKIAGTQEPLLGPDGVTPIEPAPNEPGEPRADFDASQPRDGDGKWTGGGSGGGGGGNAGGEGAAGGTEGHESHEDYRKKREPHVRDRAKRELKDHIERRKSEAQHEHAQELEKKKHELADRRKERQKDVEHEAKDVANDPDIPAHERAQRAKDYVDEQMHDHDLDAKEELRERKAELKEDLKDEIAQTKEHFRDEMYGDDHEALEDLKDAEQAVREGHDEYEGLSEHERHAEISRLRREYEQASDEELESLPQALRNFSDDVMREQRGEG